MEFTFKLIKTPEASDLTGIFELEYILGDLPVVSVYNLEKRVLDGNFLSIREGYQPLSKDDVEVDTMETDDDDIPVVISTTNWNDPDLYGDPINDPTLIKSYEFVQDTIEKVLTDSNNIVSLDDTYKPTI